MFNGTVVTAYKLLYGWGTMNTNIWLPSLRELVGIDPNQYYEPHGCYYSAMQGLNTSNNYWTDTKGGAQFAYFKQYNASGGGAKIFDACNQQVSWLRSPHCGGDRQVWAILNSTTLDSSASSLVTVSRAVHPAFSSTNGIWPSR